MRKEDLDQGKDPSRPSFFFPQLAHQLTLGGHQCCQYFFYFDAQYDWLHVYLARGACQKGMT